MCVKRKNQDYLLTLRPEQLGWICYLPRWGSLGKKQVCVFRCLELDIHIKLESGWDSSIQIQNLQRQHKHQSKTPLKVFLYLTLELLLNLRSVKVLFFSSFLHTQEIYLACFCCPNKVVCRQRCNVSNFPPPIHTLHVTTNTYICLLFLGILLLSNMEKWKYSLFLGDRGRVSYLPVSWKQRK